MKKKAAKVLVICMMLYCFANGQTAGYRYEAKIERVTQSGWYNIILTPSISAHLKTDLSDFRIVNGSGKWIPHLIRVPNSEHHIASVIMDLPMIKKETKAGITELIVGTDKDKLSNLLLQVKNTHAERFCSISGSDNLKEWFTINDSILIKPQQSDSNTATFSFNFPQVNYKYYRLIINNQNKAPFNIIGAGYQTFAEGPSIPKHYPSIPNPATSVVQKDSGKTSYVKIIQNDSYHFNEIEFKLSGPKYFNRIADFYMPSSAAHSFDNPGELLQSFSFANNSTLRYTVQGAKAAVFYIRIHNQDNLPLKVDSIKTFNNYTVATAYLEAENNYKILLDNPSAENPDYDLQQLNITGKNTLQNIPVSDISPVAQRAVAKEPGRTNQWIIWMIIAAAATVLAFFTYKLITEMNKSKA